MGEIGEFNLVYIVKVIIVSLFTTVMKSKTCGTLVYYTRGPHFLLFMIVVYSKVIITCRFRMECLILESQTRVTSAKS